MPNKASEGERVRRHSLHFLQRTPTATSAPNAPTTRRRPASAAPRIDRLPVRRQRPDFACGQRPHCLGRAQQRPAGAGAARWIDLACAIVGQQPAPAGAGGSWWIDLARGGATGLSTYTNQPQIA